MNAYSISSMVDHPEVVLIAVELILHPHRRQHYSARILQIVDATIETIKHRLDSTVKQPAPNTELSGRQK
jgi:hypothetical protein